MEETGVAPTLAAIDTDSETQGLLAWSQGEAPTDIIEYRGRGWKLPLLAALVAVGALVGLGAYVWPHHYQSAGNMQVAPAKPQVAPKPQIQASPPVQAQNPDQRFIALLRQRGQTVISEPMAIKAGHLVCQDHRAGISDAEETRRFAENTPNATMQSEAIFVDTAVEVYCP